MSRYQMNKFIAYVDEDGERVNAFHADPAGYVAAWEARAAASRLPTADSGTFTDEERRAFVERDYGTLYAMGVHPYLLLHLARALDVQIEETPWPEFVERYRAAVSPHGFPDFGT
jgi:hypothetical protein